MIRYFEDLPDLDLFEELLGARYPIVLYDQHLLHYPNATKWLGSFETGLSLSSGEQLKNIEYWPKFLKSFLPEVKGLSAEEIVLIAVGGGTVGDFVGFLASVLKRGVTLWNVPSTWLAAVDSAHGGKTAMNLSYFKNQIGTFYSSEEVFVSKALLNTQDEKQRLSAYGELLKMAVLTGGKLFRDIKNEDIWQHLPAAIEAKLDIVKKDPKETKGVRQLLNLGHTLGHAIELHNHIPHGVAVLMGLEFSLNWSRKRNLLADQEYKDILSALHRPDVQRVSVNKGQLREALLQDKKVLDGDKVRFVFVRGVGKPHLESIAVDEVIKEAEMQGWTHG